MSDSIDKIQDAFSLVWKRATNQETDKPLMSIPVNEADDADCVLMRAILELKNLRIENADLKARLIEGPKKKLVMCERCKVVTDWYGLDRACKCGCPSFSDLDPKPQGEECNKSEASNDVKVESKGIEQGSSSPPDRERLRGSGV